MAVSISNIIPAKTAENSQTTQYTSNGVQTISRDKSVGPVPALIAASVALHRAQHPAESGVLLY